MKTVRPDGRAVIKRVLESTQLEVTAAEAAAKAIHQCALERQTASSRRPIRGLGISYRDTATAVLRRWLNRAATEPLTGRSRSEVSGAEDKWIRRGDIADYERLLRTKVLV